MQIKGFETRNDAVKDNINWACKLYLLIISLRSRRKQARGRRRGARTQGKDGVLGARDLQSPFSRVLAPLPRPRLRLLCRLVKVSGYAR